MELPYLQLGELLWLDFVEPELGHIRGAFRVSKRISYYRRGYSQCLKLEPLPELSENAMVNAFLEES
jgi:hypothetical protein